MRPRASVALLAVATMLLAACGDDVSGSENADPAPSDETSAASSTEPHNATDTSALDSDSANGSDDGPGPPPEVAAPDSLGGFEVGHTSFVAQDADRADRTIPIDVWYPVDPGTAGAAVAANLPLAPGIGLESDVALEDPPVSERPGQPLVVFSHGYEGINTQSVDLMETLASHGFVVASPEHTGNSQATPGDPFDDAAANRVPDVSFVIDTMTERNRAQGDAFSGRLDEENVAVVGHSFGGMTAIGMTAGWAGADPDPRVVAIVPISAVIDGDLQASERTGPNAGFTASQLARVDVPVMLVGGTEDESVPIENNDIAFDQLTGAPAVDKVAITGATHTHFANVCTFGELLIGLGIEEAAWPDIGAADLVEPYRATCAPDVFPVDEAVRLQNLYAVAFLRRHQVGDEDYGWFLTEEFSETEPAVAFESR